MTEEEREILVGQIKELKEAMAEISRARAPFDKAMCALYGVYETLLEQHETDVVGKCETCFEPILVGDKYFPDGEDHGPFCAECAPTWSDILDNLKEAAASGYDSEDVAKSLLHAELMVAEGHGDVKPLQEDANG